MIKDANVGKAVPVGVSITNQVFKFTTLVTFIEFSHKLINIRCFSGHLMLVYLDLTSVG